MKIQYCSDLHLEYTENKNFIKDNPLKISGEILLLAGDIVRFSKLNKANDFFSFVSDNYEQVYWVPGNHEWDGGNLIDKLFHFNEKIKSNVNLINNVTVSYEDLSIIFSTLWSEIELINSSWIEQNMGDFQVIKYGDNYLSCEKFNELHKRSLEFVKFELEKRKPHKSIVVTHHVPTFLNYPPQYKGSILNTAFATELYDLIERLTPNYWIYGHHHYNCNDFIIGSTKLLTNQLGYIKYNEHKLFKNNSIIEI